MREIEKMGMKVNERERACEGGDEKEKVSWWSGLVGIQCMRGWYRDFSS